MRNFIDNIKNGGIRRVILLAIFAIMLLVLIIIAVIFAFSQFHEDYIVSANGRQTLGFRVSYLENAIFPDNPVPSNLDFMMSYTDFIEIDTRFNANFSQEMDIYYTYQTEKRFVIRPMGFADYRFVFEDIVVLSESSGSATTSQFDLPTRTYEISPKDYIEKYFYFVADQARQMAAENVIASGFRGFSAELLINFTYTIRVPEFNINQSTTHGYRLSLTTEVYNFVSTGTPNFEWQTNLAIQSRGITLPMMVSFAILVFVALFGLLYNLKQLAANPDEQQREIYDILKKYSHEIIVCDKPIDQTKHELRHVKEFEELIKLAINLSKHISCYRDDVKVEFAVIVGDYAYCWVMEYENDDFVPPATSKSDATSEKTID